MILYVIIFLLIVIILYQRYQYNRSLRHLTQIVMELKNGNLSQRFRMPSFNPTFIKLISALNKWTDQVQDKAIRLKYLEDEYREILSHLSHDLRTPLTSLLGYTEVLIDAKEISAKEQFSHISIIHEKATKIYQIISHFFELARLESSESVLDRQAFNVIDVIHETMLSFYQTVEKEGITPQIDLPDEAVKVKGSKEATERILINLISNSIRYGSSGGVLGIGLRKDESVVWIDVWDRGRGISSKDLPHIFKRLYTGNPSRTMGSQGTGLGLTISKRLVEKQGGEMRVESIPSKKTIFSFSLPIT